MARPAHEDGDAGTSPTPEPQVMLPQDRDGDGDIARQQNSESSSDSAGGTHPLGPPLEQSGGSENDNSVGTATQADVAVSIHGEAAYGEGASVGWNQDVEASLMLEGDLSGSSDNWDGAMA